MHQYYLFNNIFVGLKKNNIFVEFIQKQKKKKYIPQEKAMVINNDDN